MRQLRPRAGSGEVAETGTQSRALGTVPGDLEAPTAHSVASCRLSLTGEQVRHLYLYLVLQVRVKAPEWGCGFQVKIWLPEQYTYKREGAPLSLSV